MEAIEIIEYLRANDFEVKADGQYLDLSPAEKVTDDLIQRLRKHKPEILKELQAEERRLKVLTMLEDCPDKDRAYVTDTTIDPDNMILTIAIRELVTFEMSIPRSKYDPFLLMELIDGGQIQSVTK